MKKYYFISGMPRSGSTLLANILAQNPKFHTTATSGILDVIFTVRNSWDSLTEFKAHPQPVEKKKVLKGILDSFYSTTEKPIVFDKSRGWLSLIEMAEYILDERIKILVPVRDTRDILASFEKLWRNTSKSKQVLQERENYFKFQTIQGRCETWLQGNQPVGLAYNRLLDALNRGFRDRMHFVRFEELTSIPASTLKDIYEFLGEKEFKHNFDEVKQVTFEDDSVHGFEGLHDIRSQIKPMKPQWPTILGRFAEDYGKLNIWNY